MDCPWKEAISQLLHPSLNVCCPQMFVVIITLIFLIKQIIKVDVKKCDKYLGTEKVAGLWTGVHML
jgi:hypothetical protein